MSRRRRTHGLHTAGSRVAGRVADGLTGRRALARAEQLFAGGHTAAAAELVVRAYLRGKDPLTAAAHENVVDAVGWYVAVVADGPADGAAVDPDPVAWARYAYTAAHRLHAARPDGGSLLQVGVDALTQALLHAGRYEEALGPRWESMNVAAARGDTSGARQRHAYLVSELHYAGHCARAAAEAAAAVETALGRDPTAAVDDISDLLGFYMALQSCHRHDAAATLAAELGRNHASLAEVADLAQQPTARHLLETLTAGFRGHAALHHAGAHCDDGDCPLARDGAVGVPFYSALLSRHDPTTAAADHALISIATRLVLVADVEPRTPGLAAWAAYTDRADLTPPAHRTAPAAADTTAADPCGDTV